MAERLLDFWRRLSGIEVERLGEEHLTEEVKGRIRLALSGRKVRNLGGTASFLVGAGTIAGAGTDPSSLGAAGVLISIHAGGTALANQAYESDVKNIAKLLRGHPALSGKKFTHLSLGKNGEIFLIREKSKGTLARFLDTLPKTFRAEGDDEK